jgi:uncharacterized protein YraI
MTMYLSPFIASAAIVFASSAVADSSATVWTDLNVRSGPSVTYSIIGFVPAAQTVKVDICLDDTNWCRIVLGTLSGWASGDYLSAMTEEPIYLIREGRAVNIMQQNFVSPFVVTDHDGPDIRQSRVEHPDKVLRALAINIPVNATVPDGRIVAYVKANPIPSIYLEGEVVVGAGIPANVELLEVPHSDYLYAFVNGALVLVERKNRQVAHIVR